jgi:hypothetical protein
MRDDEAVRTSIRASDEWRQLTDTASARDQLSRSAWVREVAVAVARSGLTLPELLAVLGQRPGGSVNGQHRPNKWHTPNPRLGLSIVARTCLHPAHLITKYPTFDRCTCGHERYR